MLLQALYISISLLMAGTALALPKTEKELPLFPGLTLKSSTTPDLDPGQKKLISSAVYKEYEVNVAIDEVFKFYEEKLDAKKNKGEVIFRDGLQPGSSSPIDYGVDFHNISDDEGENGPIKGTRAPKIALMKKCRKEAAPEKWMSSGTFSWSNKDTDGATSEFMVNLEDSGLEPWTNCTKKTKVVVTITHYKSQTQMSDEENAALHAPEKAKVEAMGNKGPTEKQLGVAIYPGAAYDAAMSADSTQEGVQGFIYFVGDDAMKVVKFYESKLGKKASLGADGAYTIAIEGNLPMPKFGLQVRPNPMGGKAKSVLSFMKLNMGNGAR